MTAQNLKLKAQNQNLKRKVFLKSFEFLAFVLSFSLLTFSFHAHAATPNYAKVPEIEIQKARKGLREGEKFTYGVYWMGVPVGEASLEIKELVVMNGRQAYHIIGVARSNEFLSNFYRVQDEVHSYIDKEQLCSLRFEKRQAEGHYVSDEVVTFDQAAHRGHYESLRKKSTKDFTIPPRVQDVASAFYYFRTLDVLPRSTVTLDVNADEKNWKVDMNVIDTQQLEILRKGVRKVFCVEPKAPFKGVIAKRSKAWIYFSVDEERVPVMIKIKIPFGFVIGVLEGAQ